MSLSSVRRLAATLPGSKIAEVASLALGDPRVIPLWFGEGDLSTPRFICDAAVAALAAGQTFYTHRGGGPELREALGLYLSDLHRRPVGADRVMLTSAGMSAVMLSCQLTLDPGDNMVAVVPVWPNILAAATILGAEARPVSLVAGEDGWRLDLDRLFAACDGRTRAIFVNSPSNPTGWVASEAEWQAILDFSRARGIWIIADEVYGRIVYRDEWRAAPSVLDLAEPDDRVIVVNSFSKSWAMTGWRLGWMVVPAHTQAIVDKLIEFNTSSAPHFLQPAALTALRDGDPFVAQMRARCREGREIVAEALSRLPRVAGSLRPDGAFYAFFSVSGMEDSVAFAKRLVSEAKVGLAPGAAFGTAGEGWLRLCFASAPERLAAALDRLVPALK